MAHLQRIEREITTIRALASHALRRGDLASLPAKWSDFSPARVLRRLVVEDAGEFFLGRSSDDGPIFLAAERGAVVLAKWSRSGRHVEFFSSRLSAFVVVDGSSLESLGR